MAASVGEAGPRADAGSMLTLFTLLRFCTCGARVDDTSRFKRDER